MLKFFRQPVAMFQAPLLASLAMGTLLCLVYYSILAVWPGATGLLTRYSACHPVAYAIVWMFFVASCALFHKLYESVRQKQNLAAARTAIEEIKIARLDEDAPNEYEQLLWLEAAWKSQTSVLYNSWFGQRIRSVLSHHTATKRLDQIEETLKSASDRDADAQYDSFALIRILAWAMPMLGFLGTVLGLSATLGKMDASKLATGSQEAMDTITGGLYVAFDTTAISLVLTIFVMFAQFVVSKQELTVLNEIDSASNELLSCCLTKPSNSQDLSNVEESLKTVTNGVIKSVEKLVKKQSEAWGRSFEKAEDHWSKSAVASQEMIQQALLPAITDALLAITKPLSEHNEKIAKIHSDGAAVVDGRMQQWQVTISEQSRAIVEQQKELHKQSQLLAELIEKAELVKTMETPLQTTLQRMTDVDRFHDAAVCLTEAVAVLGTQMERYGYLGRQPLRRRAADTQLNDEADENSSPVTIPFTRKAG